MKIRFFGTRGSLPVSGKGIRLYGGNTTCVTVTSSSGKRLIFDAGSGIRDLGFSLLKHMPLELHLFFSHYHWDHIQGWPFFVPAFIPNNKIHIYGQNKGELTVKKMLENLMTAPNHPVPLSIMGASLDFNQLQEDGRIEIDETLTVEYGPLYHPNGVIGFRITDGEQVFAFLTDVEHRDSAEIDKSLLYLARNADVVAYDCQYTPEEYPTKVTWGHSTWEEGIELVSQAGAKKLLMIHHDPTHDDEFINNMLNEATKPAEKRGIQVGAAYEGLEIDLS
jgi:phosphoribosyl 1,2-cyclic phosphodiesterase